MSAIHPSNFTEELYRQVNKGLLRGNYLRDRQLDYSADKTEHEYSIYNRKGLLVASFRARPLPGCCGVLVIYYLRPGHTIKEPEKTFMQALDLIVETAGLAKYGLVMLTQTEVSEGFKALHSTNKGLNMALFVNHKTSNKIGVFMLDTKAPTEEAKKPNFSSE